MNNATMARALSRRTAPPAAKLNGTAAKPAAPAPAPAAPKPLQPSPALQRCLQGAKAATDAGEHSNAVALYATYLKENGYSEEMRDPKIGGNLNLLMGKAAMAAGDTVTAVAKLTAAGALLPGNPQIWRSLAEVHESTGNMRGLETALSHSIEVAESKGNYSKSRPLRLRLSEVQETLGDKASALATLKAFISNGKAAAAPAEEGSPSHTAEDMNELMRLKCSALTRGLSGIAVALPSPDALPQPPARMSQRPPTKDGSMSGSKDAGGALRGRSAAMSPLPHRSSTPGGDVASPAHSVRSVGSNTSVATSVTAGYQPKEHAVAGWILQSANKLAASMAELRALGDTERLSRLSAHCVVLSGDESGEVRRKAAVSIAEAVAASADETPWVQAQLAGFLTDASSPLSREGALLAIQAQCQIARAMVEPFLVPLMSAVLSAHADAAAPVRAAAAEAGMAIVHALNPQAVRIVLPALVEGMESREWRTKVGALEMVAALAMRAPAQTAAALPEIVPIVSLQVWDTHRQVQSASKHALMAACACIANPDIEPLVDRLVSVIGHPEETHSTLDALLATTFVTRVDCATLSVIAPLLGKCLRERAAAVRRKASKVIGNLVRLVTDPSDVAPFIPLLLPALQKTVVETADPEVAEVASEALDVLVRALGTGREAERARSGVAGPKPEEVSAMRAEMASHLRRAMLSCDVATRLGEEASAYIASLCTCLVMYGHGDEGPTDINNWRDAVLPYLRVAIESEEECETVFEAFHKAAAGSLYDDDDEKDVTELCNIEFSLAYGGKILLHNTPLRLVAGRRYGLIGANGVGKTTLMRNIASRNIDGLPEKLRTVFVEHDIVGSEAHTPVIDFMAAVPELQDVAREEISKSLSDVGFTLEMQDAAVSSLSGGWKMKLALVRAMLMNANVLLLDEPTNHLDTTAVAWLTRYLAGLTDVTVLVVSHDTAFVDNVVTDILHYEQQKLVPYHGNLSHFVRLRPEASSYYQLSQSLMRFKLPNPGPLDGINSTTKSILTMNNVTFHYPGCEKPSLIDVSLKLVLASRVAVVGANGAGKSTLIKLVVRETEPDPGSGEVWAHHNLRIAYVAQHSFHHVEQHLQKSPVQYMQWRYGTGDGTDRETIENSASLKLSEEEEARMSKAGAIESIKGRRKTGRTMEYECSFVEMGPEFDRYITLEKLVEMGYTKMVQLADKRIAAQAAGIDSRPTTTREIQAHLDDFALAPEFSVHGKVGGLSGGQKVKLVLAAAMWNRPHLLVLDEPTNYLDREALGALTIGIREFGGGVIMISHNKEFLKEICTETWLLEENRLYTKGEAKETELKTTSKRSQETEEPEEVVQAGCTNAVINYENIINPKSLKFLSKKEIRKIAKLAEKAEISVPDYVAKITRASPEWKWLSA